MVVLFLIFLLLLCGCYCCLHWRRLEKVYCCRYAIKLNHRTFSFCNLTTDAHLFLESLLNHMSQTSIKLPLALLERWRCLGKSREMNNNYDNGRNVNSIFNVSPLYFHNTTICSTSHTHTQWNGEMPWWTILKCEYFGKQRQKEYWESVQTNGNFRNARKSDERLELSFSKRKTNKGLLFSTWFNQNILLVRWHLAVRTLWSFFSCSFFLLLFFVSHSFTFFSFSRSRSFSNYSIWLFCLFVFILPGMFSWLSNLLCMFTAYWAFIAKSFWWEMLA